MGVVLQYCAYLLLNRFTDSWLPHGSSMNHYHIVYILALLFVLPQLVIRSKLQILKFNINDCQCLRLVSLSEQCHGAVKERKKKDNEILLDSARWQKPTSEILRFKTFQKSIRSLGKYLPIFSGSAASLIFSTGYEYEDGNFIKKK